MMERLEAISHGLTVSYDQGNRVFILYPTMMHTFFRPPSMWTSALDVHAIAEIETEIKSMLALVDQLDAYKPPVAGEEPPVTEEAPDDGAPPPAAAEAPDDDEAPSPDMFN